MNNVIDYLIKVKNLLLAGWCKKSFALKNGEKVEAFGNNADQYCLMGAIYHLMDNQQNTWREAAASLTSMKCFGKISDLNKVCDVVELIIFNDNAKNKEEVLDLIDRTIKELKKDAVHESGTN